MTSYELLDEIERFQSAFPPKGVLVKAVDTAAELFDRLEGSLELRGLHGPSAYFRLLRAFRYPDVQDKQIEVNPRQVLEDAGELLKQIRSRQLFAEIESIERYF